MKTFCPIESVAFAELLRLGFLYIFAHNHFGIDSQIPYHVGRGSGKSILFVFGL